MKYIKAHTFLILAAFASVLFFGVPSFSFAQGQIGSESNPIVLDDMEVTAERTTTSGGRTFQTIVTDYIITIGNGLVKFIIGLTVLVFIYGLMKYMFKGAGSDTARSEGRTLMLWGVIGLFVMTSVWGLVGIFGSVIGHNTTVVPQFKGVGSAAVPTTGTTGGTSNAAVPGGGGGTTATTTRQTMADRIREAFERMQEILQRNQK